MNKRYYMAWRPAVQSIEQMAHALREPMRNTETNLSKWAAEDRLQYRLANRVWECRHCGHDVRGDEDHLCWPFRPGAYIALGRRCLGVAKVFTSLLVLFTLLLLPALAPAQSYTMGDGSVFQPVHYVPIQRPSYLLMSTQVDRTPREWNGGGRGDSGIAAAWAGDQAVKPTCRMVVTRWEAFEDVSVLCGGDEG